MNRIATLLLITFFSCTAVAGDALVNGMMKKRSQNSVQATLDKLERIVTSKGFKVG
ncbi:MAG: hypothetical protein HOI95_02795 [Chromatiales bacterium]|jgi:hypothetical protein|nr:hypothetical protein [Chromatiales bacterium]